MAVLLSWCVLAVAAASASATSLVPRHTSSDPLAACPGYKASRVQTTASGLTADLTLAGAACNAYGTDLKDLTLEVVYETGKFDKLPLFFVNWL
jgi:alpha-glucosidase